MNTPGFRFKEGKLFLFDQKSLSVIEAWPSLKALRKNGSFGWQEFRPIFPLLSPMGAEPEIDPALLPRESFQMAYQRRAAFRAFRSFIPEALAKARAALDAVRADGSNGAHNYELAKSILEDALGSLVSK